MARFNFQESEDRWDCAVEKDFLELSLDQDLGSEFQFLPDEDALKSIVENRGINQHQKYEKMAEYTQSRTVHTPSTGGKEQYQFFQGKDGHVFFRRKVSTPAGRKKKFDPERFKPVRFKTGSFGKKDTFKKPHSFNKENIKPKTWSQSVEKKRALDQGSHFHLQSISEIKPKSMLPVAQDSTAARKSLYFGKGSKAGFKKPLTPEKDGSALPLYPLTQLNRDSARFLPRESLAWLNQLPRDSATFLELEKMMGEKDQFLVNEDDTFSFEALECRVRTPMRPPVRITCTARFSEDLANDTKGVLEAVERVCANEDKEEKKVETKQGTDISTKQSNAELELELENLPLNPILGTSTLRSMSMSNLDPETENFEVARAQSVEDLREGVITSRIVSTKEISKVLEDLERFRIEQDELQRQQEELFLKIRERKKAFKEIWGVSPMRINTKRTVIPKHSESTEPNFTKSLLTESEDRSASGAIPSDSFHSSPTSSTPSVNNIKSKASVAAPAPATDAETPGTDAVTPAMQAEIRKVRFQSGENQHRLLTPDSCKQDCSATSNPVSAPSLSNQSFASLKTSFSFLQTPVGSKAGNADRIVNRQGAHLLHQKVQENEDNTVSVRLGVPTPVALKTLSALVKEEYALLYAESSESESEEESVDIIRQIKF
ncbi:uncharacterized protein LOC111713575 isoform X3 [Eurytemora carolleeae]|uniref:uncharacterized protein LOC111713575 isoform X3 n=1 Tax=Eurytemora carolleeae TaxID=1294199 RepID=UPI000C7827E7|nr:uncharacterized protein LOC111713575 isoform X3 [Eurytemora carolleeae]|eukprot:XP_023344238.1 uncharacterized protein LOC111713575 isoform X3 [Eurytemora affinis]